MSTEVREAAHSHDHNEDALRTEALESLLIEKGLLDPEEMEELVRSYESAIGPMKGARVVARAWIDPDYKRRLLEDGVSGVDELGLGPLETKVFQVVENTPRVHNVIVCTLCSCYPGILLGKPPTWYKSFEYRSRVVREPRRVLEEFGLELDDSVEIRVWDSTSELRYMVLPERPAGTEGLSEEELVKLVTRDSMVGVAKIAPPGGE